MKFIQLTRDTGNPLFVNPARIISLEPAVAGTVAKAIVHLSPTQSVYVLETYGDILILLRAL